MKDNFFIKTAKINTEIYKNNLSILNFGNASILDKKRENIFIKASGVYTKLCKRNDIVKVNLKNPKKLLPKSLKPSVDTAMHIELYKNLKNINCIIHAHSQYATILAQANVEPKCLGTTHADYFYDMIPLSKKINKLDELNYEHQLGRSIIFRLKKYKKYCPGILLRDHGLVAWGANDKEAINNLIAIEFISKIYYKTSLIINKPKINNSVKNFHYKRKHGIKSYYGQKK